MLCQVLESPAKYSDEAHCREYVDHAKAPGLALEKMSLHLVLTKDLPATCADWQAACHLEEEATAQGLKKI